MQFNAAGAFIEPIILTYEMEEAKQRWRHLVPEHDHRQQISDLKATPERPGIERCRQAGKQS